MTVSTRRWVLAALATLSLAVWQRYSGPTRPVGGAAGIGGVEFSYRLPRSFAGPGDAPVKLPAATATLSARLAFRKHASADPWTTVDFTRQGAELVAALPHQPPAGKLDYKLRLQDGGELLWLHSGNPVTIRFRGDVPLWILAPHVVAMFAAMLLAARTGFAAAGGETFKPLLLSAFLALTSGGMLLGPAVQKMAFGDWWTGWPVSSDLTDNKTAFAWLLMGVALWRGGKWWAMAAALVAFVIFAIPHSVLSGNVAR
jgi:hypothetical protein